MHKKIHVTTSSVQRLQRSVIEFSLFVLLFSSLNAELIIPATGNVFYAMTSSSVDFLLRRKGGNTPLGSQPINTETSATFPRIKAKGRRLVRTLFWQQIFLCGLLCAKTKLDMRLFVSCSHNACSTKKHQDQVLLRLFLSATPERVLSNISNLQPPCCVHQSRLLQFPQTVCISHSHLKRRATEAFNWLLLWCWLSSPSQVALDAFFSFFHPNSMIRISFNLPIAK